jgi:hypothetical protein
LIFEYTSAEGLPKISRARMLKEGCPLQSGVDGRIEMGDKLRRRIAHRCYMVNQSVPNDTI